MYKLFENIRTILFTYFWNITRLNIVVRCTQERKIFSNNLKIYSCN